MDKIEGIITIDGMIEGKMTLTQDLVGKLQEWINFSSSLDFEFSLEMGSNSFNILAEKKQISVKKFGPDPAKKIMDTISELISVIPEEYKSRLFSTLRTIEYEPGLEIQTIYAILPDGKIECQTRTIKAKTTSFSHPVFRKHMRPVITGVIVSLVLLFASSFFVNYSQLIKDFGNSLSSVKTDSIKINNELFSSFFFCEQIQWDEGREQIVLVLKRTDSFFTAISNLKLSENENLEKNLIIESITKGYIRCEIFNSEQIFLGFSFLRIKDLWQRDSIEAAFNLSLKAKSEIDTIVFTY